MRLPEQIVKDLEALKESRKQLDAKELQLLQELKEIQDTTAKYLLAYKAVGISPNY